MILNIDQGRVQIPQRKKKPGKTLTCICNLASYLHTVNTGTACKSTHTHTYTEHPNVHLLSAGCATVTGLNKLFSPSPLCVCSKHAILPPVNICHNQQRFHTPQKSNRVGGRLFAANVITRRANKFALTFLIGGLDLLIPFQM